MPVAAKPLPDFGQDLLELGSAGLTDDNRQTRGLSTVIFQIARSKRRERSYRNLQTKAHVSPFRKGRLAKGRDNTHHHNLENYGTSIPSALFLHRYGRGLFLQRR